MSKYKNWNIRDLISEQMEVSAEIAARVMAVEQMDNNYHTYNPNGDAQSYKILMEAAIELLRKGQKIAHLEGGGE
ncbi:MAG TPA: hypothetical protein DCE71_07880 [Parachlamydiales bacterium]|nr:hypothetical protein [Parachlamydiales bacterium]